MVTTCSFVVVSIIFQLGFTFLTPDTTIPPIKPHSQIIWPCVGCSCGYLKITSFVSLIKIWCNINV